MSGGLADARSYYWLRCVTQIVFSSRPVQHAGQTGHAGQGPRRHCSPAHSDHDESLRTGTQPVPIQSRQMRSQNWTH